MFPDSAALFYKLKVYTVKFMTKYGFEILFTKMSLIT